MNYDISIVHGALRDKAIKTFRQYLSFSNDEPTPDELTVIVDDNGAYEIYDMAKDDDEAHEMTLSKHNGDFAVMWSRRSAADIVKLRALDRVKQNSLVASLYRRN